METALTRGFASLLILAALSLGAPAPATAQTGQDSFAVAAFVDGKAITNFDVDQRARLLVLAGLSQRPNFEAGLQSMIDERIKRAAAEEDGARLRPGELDAGVARFASAAGANSPAELQRVLRSNGLSPIIVQEYVETELLWTTVVRQRFGDQAVVTEEDVDDEIAFGGGGVRVSYDLGQIAIPAGRDRSVAELEAQQIVRDIRNGTLSFEEAARKHSRLPNRSKGGRAGWTPGSQFPPRVNDVLSSLAPGEPTDPLEVGAGYVILTAFDRREEKVEVTPEQREALRQRLLEDRLRLLADGRLQELRARVYVQRR